MKVRKESQPTAPALPLDDILRGDSREVLASFPAKSIHAVVTSPPYFQQRDYGTPGIGSEPTTGKYIESLLPILEHCARVLTDDGSLFLNVGDKYEDSSLLLVPYLLASEVTKKTGLKLINQITWVKPNPQPRQFTRRLVSATEPVFHFVKSSSYKYFPDRFLEGEKILREKRDNSKGNTGRSYFRLIEESVLSAAEKRAARQELEEVIQEVKQGKVWSFRMKIRGIHSAAYGGFEGGRKLHIDSKGFTVIRMYDRPMKRDVIETPIVQDRFLKHPAMFPTALVRECLNLTTEPGDIVLDPFIGSGTTAVVAKAMGRRYIGIELEPTYRALALKRLAETKPEPTMQELIV